jgi:Flp pilus assembly protein TadD
MVAFALGTGGNSGSKLEGSTVIELSSAASSVIDGFLGSIAASGAFASDFGEIIAEEDVSFGFCAAARLTSSRHPTAIARLGTELKIPDMDFTRPLDADPGAKVVDFASESRYLTANLAPYPASKARRQQLRPKGNFFMLSKKWLLGLALIAAVELACQGAEAGDIKITIPKRSKLTPVQRLNREGVEAVRKHNYKKAEELFYKAYLFDPDDAFTLNNLGYIAELQGQIDRAQQFYSLAAEQPSEAVVDISSKNELRGQPMRAALGVTNEPLQINHANVEAVRLLQQGRAPEADLLLQEVLKRDSGNVFTLNNMGVAKEMEGEQQEALRYFDEASRAVSDATAVVTANPDWRGRQVSQMAQQNAKALRERLSHEQDLPEQVAEFNLRGVSAVNRNDLRTANADFRKAYALDPGNAFTLNNIGYVAELEGDRETAEFFYQQARQAGGADLTVGVATSRTAEGRKLFTVAEDNGTRVESKVAQEQTTLRRQEGPVALRRRDNSIVEDSIPGTGSTQPKP